MPPNEFFAILLHRIPRWDAVFLSMAIKGSPVFNIKNATIMQTNSQSVSFEQLPEAVAKLMDDMAEVKSFLQDLTKQSFSKAPEWMSVNNLISYLPGHPATQTIYCWVCKKKIPYHKAGAKLQFLKSEIDAWLMGESIGTIESGDEIRIPVKARKSSARKGGLK